METAELTRLLASLRETTQPQLAFVRGGGHSGPGSLAILSASFNPITRAHERMLERAEAVHPSEHRLLVLALANVDKPVEGLPLETRMELLQAWAENRDAALAFCSHGRFLDKRIAIRASFPNARLCFLVGYDTLVRLFDSKYYDHLPSALNALFADCEFLAFNRAPHGLDRLGALLAQPQVRPYAHRIHPVELETDAASISATEVRRRLADGLPVDGLVPPVVARKLAARASRPSAGEP